MASLGAYLRELREKRGTSLEEIARSTRVAGRYLTSLEAEDFEALPAPVFTRGFIRAYCQLFGVAPDEALGLYDEREGAPPAAAPPSPRVIAAARGARPKPAGVASAAAANTEEPRSRSAVLVSFVLLVVLGMALFALTLMIQPGRDVDRRVATPAAPDSRTVELPAPATPGVPVPPATGTAPPAPVTGPPVEVMAPPPQSANFTSPYRLVARAVESTWIRVRTEDGRSTEETVPAGEVREWVSSRPFVLTVGNAGGITLELNGRELPSLGARGAVITRLVVPPEAR
jgi:cytoskeleton protein RodZ